MNRKGADETRVRPRASLRSDAYGIGGFFEAIMAMVIVTSGLLLLTFSLTLLSVDDGEGSEDLDHRCESTLNSILDNPAWSRGSMMLDHRDLARADWTSFKGEGGAKVILTYPDGTTEVLHQQGKVYDGERSCRSAPVNIYFHQADVRAALITVWVWA